MSETVSKRLVFPVTGESVSVTLPRENNASELVDIDDAYNGFEVIFHDPNERGSGSWFEVSWSLEREDGDETMIEEDGVLEVYCPNCGDKEVFAFDGDEFEHLGFCSSCGDAEVIRDQPTESGQSHMINYRILF